MCMSKVRGWPQDRRMPDPWAMQNLLMPQHRDCQGRQMPHKWPRGKGEWAQLELTDALGEGIKLKTVL